MVDRVSPVSLAMGRILRMAARPAEPGDVDEYEMCRALILDHLGPDGPLPEGYRPSWARDRLRGASGG